MKRNSKYAKLVVNRGGEAYLIGHIREFMARDKSRASNFVQLLGMVLSEGPADVMVMTGMLHRNTEQAQRFEQFVEALPFFLGEIPD